MPDISLLEPLANILKVSLPELLSGQQIINANRSANMMRTKLYVCPICGNVLRAIGSAMVSCCGIALPPLEAEQDDTDHQIICERIEDEYYVTLAHPMTKEHYISFIAFCNEDRFELVKLYPEGDARARFFIRGRGKLYWYCKRNCKRLSERRRFCRSRNRNFLFKGLSGRPLSGLLFLLVPNPWTVYPPG